jgi:Zn-dependent protease/CBS domain-containing protein
MILMKRRETNVNGIRIGRVFGIEIAIHPSWFIILCLFTFSLATGFFPRVYTTWSPAEAWLVAAAATILLFASVLAHELGHSLVARAQGIPVRNITLFLLGGVSTLEAEATSPGREALMAGVGPLVSLGLGLASWAASLLPGPQQVQAILLYLGLANVSLAVFNLLPGLPLDGGRILQAFLWWRSHDRLRAARGAATVGRVVGFLFIAFGMLQVLGGSAFGGFWLALIGWVIVQGSRAAADQAFVRRDLAGATASRIMTEPGGWLRPFVTLDRAAQQGFHDFASHCLAVEAEEEGQVFDGLVCTRDLEVTPRPEWDVRRVREAMVPARDIPVVAPDAPALEVLSLLQATRAQRIAVVAEGRLLGVVDAATVDRYLRLRDARRQRPEHRLRAA